MAGKYILILILLTGCASSTSQKKVLKLRALVKEKDLSEALNLVQCKNFYSSTRSIFLKLIEEGMIYHLKGDYFKSSNIFEKAKSISDKLYTKSVGYKIKSIIVNDGSDIYYGSKYERSFIRFYQALNFFLLSLPGSFRFDTVNGAEKGNTLKSIQVKKVLTDGERRKQLYRAKAILVEWDSLLDEYRDQLSGKGAYKDDMAAKLLGAIIHERLGTINDNNTAKILYKDAKKLLVRNYSSFSDYNILFKRYQEDFSKFPKFGQAKVERDYIKKTNMYKVLNRYIDNGIANIKKHRIQNFKILVTENFIARKKAKKYYFPIQLGTNLSMDVSNRKNFKKFITSIYADLSVSFELPKIIIPKREAPLRLIIQKKKSGTVIKDIQLALIEPLSSIAKLTFDNHIVGTKVKTGLRVMLKHLAALVVSYKVYKSMVKKGISSVIARNLAITSYIISNKAIQKSERADLRLWSTLPNNVWLGGANLNVGTYYIFLKSMGKIVKNFGKITIRPKEKFFKKIRIFGHNY